jgi:hypothetical protein
VSKIPEYDNLPDNYKINIENQCIKKFPERENKVSQSGLEKKIIWENYKGIFDHILDRERLRNDIDQALLKIKENIVPKSAPICC